MKESLQTELKKLRLSGLTRSLDVRLQEAAGNSLNHEEFLELILQDELLVRSERQINRRIKAAAFKELKTLEDFDWQFNPSVKRKQIYDLATCQFIEKGLDVCWLGPPGTGKSHLCQAIGYQAIMAGLPYGIVPSLIYPETSCTRKPLPERIRCWPSTLSRIY